MSELICRQTLRHLDTQWFVPKLEVFKDNLKCIQFISIFF